MDNYKTDIIFRYDLTKGFKGTILALFPHEVWDRSGNVTSYLHVGQHGAADYRICIRASRPATPEEYNVLKKELEDRGYNINVVKKQNYKKYLIEYNKRAR